MTHKPEFCISLIGLIALIFSTNICTASTCGTNFYFFYEKINIEYPCEIKIDYNSPPNKWVMGLKDDDLQRVDFTKTIDSFLKLKVKYQLDDWLFYSLLKKFALSIDEREEYSSFYIWSILKRCHYDVRLTITNGKRKELRLLVCGSIDYENYFTVWELEGKKYVDIDTNFKKGEKRYYNIGASNGSKQMQFEPQMNFGIPLHTFQLKKTLFFGNNDSTEVFLSFSQTMLDIRKEYPTMNLNKYYEIKINEKTLETLDKILSPRLKHKNKLNTLYNFAVQNCLFGFDNEIKGREEAPLTFEEILYYGKGDCEDFALFLYQLITRYTDMKVIVIAYPDHVHIAIDAKLFEKNDYKSDVFKLDGEDFLILEYTDIENIKDKRSLYLSAHMNSEYYRTTSLGEVIAKNF